LPLNPHEAAGLLKGGVADSPSDASIPREAPTADPSQTVAPARSLDSADGKALASNPARSPEDASTATTIADAATPPRVTASKPLARAPVPALPILPAVPKVGGKTSKPTSADKTLSPEASVATPSAQSDDKTASSVTLDGAQGPEEAKIELKPAAPPIQSGPKSWANLFSKPAATSAAPAAVATPAGTGSSEVTATGEAQSAAGNNGIGNFAKLNSSSMAEALRAYRVGNAEKTAFIEPRGLTNTGNMCYMNSVSDSSTRGPTKAINRVCRYYKFSFSAHHSTTSWIRPARRLPTASRAKRP